MVFFFRLNTLHLAGELKNKRRSILFGLGESLLIGAIYLNNLEVKELQNFLVGLME
jgi:hypothetical protein